MRAAAASAGAERWSGEPHQPQQQDENSRRNPEDFVGGDNQPLVGYLLRYPAGRLLLRHSHALQLIVYLLRDIFEPLIDEHHYSEEEQSIVKQADALCAYLKCLEELSAGNNEFLLAKGRLEKTLASRRSAEMDYFMQVFVPSFQLSLDEISQDSPL